MSRKTRRLVETTVHALIHGRGDNGKFAISAGALGALTLSGQIFAADATPESTSAPADQPLEEIVVTGIRASLQKSLDIKQQSVGVVDAISAEDIGAFPDASLGEAMQRIPGITVTRTTARNMGGPELYTGNPSGVTVRGFGGDFNETLIDGRPLASAAGRSFDFSSVGADFVGEVDVLKTPDFNLSSGAVGATVNIKFPKPFDHPGLQARAFGSMTDTTNDGSFRPSVGALLSNTFFDDTLGILVDGDYADTRISAHHQDIVGWKGTYLNSCQMAGGPACLDKNGNVIPKNSLILANGQAYTPTNPKNTFPSWFPQEYQLYNDRTDDRRKDGRAVIQWHPTDALLVTLDDNYSDENLFSLRYNYSTWFNSAQMYDVQQDSNGTITNFQYGPAPTDLNAGTGGSFIRNNTLGLNVKWDVNDKLRLQLDADQSASHLNPNGASFFSVDVGYGPSYAINNTSPARFAALQAAGFPNAYVGGIVVPGGSNSLPYYNAYGPNNNPANVFGLNPLILGSHVLPIGSNRGSDYINQAKLDADWHTGNTEVDFGLQFVEDTRNSYNLSSFANNGWQLWSGYGSPSGNTGGQALPASLFANSGAINTSNFLPAFGNNAQLPPIFMYNPYTVYSYLTGLGAAGANPGTISPVPPACVAGKPGCFSPYTGGPEPYPLDPGSISFVQEKSYSPFVTLQQKLNIAGRALTLNVGLRYERSNTTTGGYGRVPVSLTPGAQDHTAFVVNYSDPQFLTSAHQYSYFLPSLDLNFFPLADLKVRLDASRTLTRPPLTEITPTLSVAGSPRIGSLGLTGNNPGLLPYLANNFDLGAEWYYGQNEYLSVDGFFKHVSQFPEQQTVNVTLPGVIDPSTGQLAQWAETTFVNSPAANVYGLEIGWQQMLVYGFGYQLNGTVVHTNEPYNRYNLGPQFFLPGLANSANFVGFYQNRGFQARVAVNWTATQLVDTVQEQPGGAFGNEPVFTRPFTEVDFSTQYDINQHVSVFFKALNLTDAEVIEHGRFDNQLLNVQEIGRTFTMGVRAKL